MGLWARPPIFWPPIGPTTRHKVLNCWLTFPSVRPAKLPIYLHTTSTCQLTNRPTSQPTYTTNQQDNPAASRPTQQTKQLMLSYPRMDHPKPFRQGSGQRIGPKDSGAGGLGAATPTNYWPQPIGPTRHKVFKLAHLPTNQPASQPSLANVWKP